MSALLPVERGWITFDEARSLFSTKGEQYAFGETRSAALAKAGRAGIIINLNDKEDFADELFMASKILEEVKKTGADKWCEKTAVSTVQFLSK